jgi:aryl-alcohol dehydrogenase-like predicted oxidoreductase
MVSRLQELARKKGVSVAQIALGWILTKGNDIIPIPGARRREQLTESLECLKLSFSPDEIAAIERAVPEGSVAGDRYMAEQMAALDSERKAGASNSAR